MQAQALHVAQVIADERWLLVQKSAADIPAVFVALLISWLALLFASFGLFAPRNMTVLVALMFCALAISGGIFTIVELADGTRGAVRTSTNPLTDLAVQLQRAS